MNKEAEEDVQHVLETERLIIKDEVIESVYLGQIKTEPEDNYRSETPDESFLSITIDPLPNCKVENEDSNEVQNSTQVNIETDTTGSENVKEKAENANQSVDVPEETPKASNPDTHCHICDKEFRRHSALIGHMKSHFDDFPDFECDVCKKAFKTESSLQKHRDIHFRHFFDCKYCDFSTYSSTERFLHKQLCTGPKTLYKCRTCSFETSSVRAKDEHVRLMHKSQKKQDVLFKCQSCDFQTKDNNAKISHLKKHGKSVIYKCRQCSYETQDENAKNVHEQTFHIVKIPTAYTRLQCGVCSQKFLDVSQFFEHKKIHDVTECNECGKILADKSNMFLKLAHLEKFSKMCQSCGSKFSFCSASELNEEFHKRNNCKCDTCGKQFILPSDMFLHQKEEHENENFEIKSEVDKIRNRFSNGQHTCKICRNKCKGIVEHAKHMVGHWKKNDYALKCRVCGAHFNSMLQLLDHRKIHSKVFSK